MSTFLLEPDRDNGYLTPDQKTYNNANSSKSVDTEIRFGPLKVKFRKLKFLDVNKVYLIHNIIVTCCVLHKCIFSKEPYIEDDIYISQEDTALGSNTTQKASI